jgi:hypothetical protein
MGLNLTYNLCQKLWDMHICCNFTQFERRSALRFPSSMLGPQKSDVLFQDANIETGGGGGEGGGTNVSRNGMIYLSAVVQCILPKVAV